MLPGLGGISYNHAIPSNDSRYFPPQYAPPDYNIELAKPLFEQAGYPDGMYVTRHMAEVGPGMVEMAVAFKGSAAPAG